MNMKIKKLLISKTTLMISLAACFASHAFALDPFTVKDIRVEGLQRVEAGTVFATLPFQIGDTYDDEKATLSIRNLIALGLFKDVKITNNGGVRVTPINLQQSIIRKTTVLDNTRIYEERLPDIFRIDLQVQWKTQYKKMTGSLIAGVQNLTNRKNPVRQYYDSGIGGIRYNYLLALIPVVGYKIDF